VCAAPVTESRDVALKEAARLQKLHTQLTAASATNAVQQLRAAAADANGTLLQQLRQWREQRVLAIELEVDRLLHDWGISQAELAAAVASPSIAQQHTAASEDRPDTGPKLAISSRYKDGEVWSRLMQWLQKYGAVVSSCAVMPVPLSRVTRCDVCDVFNPRLAGSACVAMTMRAI